MNQVFLMHFKVEMIDILGRGALWHSDDDPFYGRSSWYAGQKKALQSLAEEDFGIGSKPYQLKPYKLKRGLPGCQECLDIQAERRDLRSDHATPERLQANTDRALKHADEYMGERKKLEEMKRSCGRADTVFLMRDKCGDDCLYTPSAPRESSANNGLYKYRMAMMAEIVPGKLMTLSLIPRNVITGGDFGGTSLLGAISDMMDAGTTTTTRPPPPPNCPRRPHAHV